MKLRTRLVPFLSLQLLLTVEGHANAQSETKTPRIELGAHFAMMGKFDATRREAEELALEPEEFSRNPNLGIGARATFNINRYIGLETEWNILPQESEYSGWCGTGIIHAAARSCADRRRGHCSAFQQR